MSACYVIVSIDSDVAIERDHLRSLSPRSSGQRPGVSPLRSAADQNPRRALDTILGGNRHACGSLDRPIDRRASESARKDKRSRRLQDYWQWGSARSRGRNLRGDLFVGFLSVQVESTSANRKPIIRGRTGAFLVE